MCTLSHGGIILMLPITICPVGPHTLGAYIPYMGRREGGMLPSFTSTDWAAAWLLAQVFLMSVSMLVMQLQEE